MRHIEGADLVFYAPPAELVEESTSLRRNARVTRSKRVAGAKKPAYPVISGDDYERSLVRTAIVRSSTFDPDKLIQATSPYHVALVLEHLVSADQEHFVTIAVDQSMQIVGIHETGIGPTGYVSLSPPDVIKIPILCGVRQFFVAHNHPSGTPQPSREDYQTIENLKQAADCVGLSLLDSFVVGYRGVYSMGEEEQISWAQAHAMVK